MFGCVNLVQVACAVSRRAARRRKGTMSTDSQPAWAPSAQLDADGKAQLSNMYSIFVLASWMFDGRGADSILALAADAVSSLSRCRTEATYLFIDELLTACKTYALVAMNWCGVGNGQA